MPSECLKYVQNTYCRDYSTVATYFDFELEYGDSSMAGTSFGAMNLNITLANFFIVATSEPVGLDR